MPLINRVGGGSAELQSKTVKATTSEQTVTPDNGYDGLDRVTVNAIQTQSKTVDPVSSEQTITPDSGKYLSSVVVNAMPFFWTTITPSTNTRYVTITDEQISGDGDYVVAVFPFKLVKSKLETSQLGWAMYIKGGTDQTYDHIKEMVWLSGGSNGSYPTVALNGTTIEIDVGTNLLAGNTYIVIFAPTEYI